MKKFIFFILAVLLFAGCTNPISSNSDARGATAIQTSDGVRYVRNSVWEACSLSYLTAKSAGRAADAEITAEELEVIVDTINETTNDDQLFVLEEDIPIEESPLVNIYIVNEGDYVLLKEYLDLDRAEFASRRYAYELDAQGLGGILFVDKVPPVPVIPPDLRTPHEKYHIQMVNKYDKIVVYNGFRYEESCEETWEAFDGTGPARGYPTIDDYFASRVAAYEGDIRGVGLVPEDAPWRVVSGQIFVEAIEPPVE